jgi:hypothetical protein
MKAVAESLPYRGGRVPQPDADDQAPAERSPMFCAAHGCPCTGETDPASTGRFFCRWHVGIAPDRWQETTRLLRSNGELITVISELQRLHTWGGKGQPWVHRARRAFAGEPDMQPTDLEVESWNFYLWRLREELAFRCEVRQDRPAPRVPQGREEFAHARAFQTSSEAAS